MEGASVSEVNESSLQPRLSWRERSVCRILLIVAKLLAPSVIVDDIKHLANHISVEGARND